MSRSRSLEDAQNDWENATAKSKLDFNKKYFESKGKVDAENLAIYPRLKALENAFGTFLSETDIKLSQLIDTLKIAGQKQGKLQQSLEAGASSNEKKLFNMQSGAATHDDGPKSLDTVIALASDRIADEEDTFETEMSSSDLRMDNAIETVEMDTRNPFQVSENALLEEGYATAKAIKEMLEKADGAAKESEEKFKETVKPVEESIRGLDDRVAKAEVSSVSTGRSLTFTEENVEKMLSGFQSIADASVSTLTDFGEDVLQRGYGGLVSRTQEDADRHTFSY